MEISLQRLRLPRVGSGTERPPAAAAPLAGCAPPIRFATISDIGAFRALASEWAALFEADGRPHQVFQTVEWLAIWASLYVDARTRLSIVTGRIDGRLVLVWPLVVRHAFGLRILSSMGEPLSQYADAIMAEGLDAAVQDAALDYLTSLQVDVVSLRRVRGDAAVHALLRRRWGAPTNRQASPYVLFEGVKGPDAFEKRFSGKLRASRRRRRRRIEEKGPIAFVHHGPSLEAATLVATALRFKREWACRTGIVAPSLRDPRFEQFFVEAASAGARAPDLRISALHCGEAIAGVEISVACQGHLVGHVLAPNPEFSHLGVGGILAEMTVVTALERGFASIDLLAPADAYKLEWTATTTEVGDYAVARTLRGALYMRLWLGFGREAVKAIAHRLQPILAGFSRRLGSRGRTRACSSRADSPGQ